MTSSRRPHLVAAVVAVLHPAVEPGPPVLEQELLGVLLALAVAEAALGLGARDEVLALQVHLEVLADLARDLRLGAPRAAVRLLANPVIKTKIIELKRKKSSKKTGLIY